MAHCMVDIIKVYDIKSSGCKDEEDKKVGYKSVFRICSIYRLITLVADVSVIIIRGLVQQRRYFRISVYIGLP